MICRLFPDNVYGAQSSFVPSLGKVVVFGRSYPAQTQAAFLPLTVLSTSVGLPASLHDYLDVMCQEVVVIETCSADGWLLVETGVRPVPVVLVGPGWE